MTPADAPKPLARYGFRLPDGSERRLDAVYRLGRRPVPSRVDDGSPSRLITISSQTSAVSGTHLEIRQDGDSVVVTDVGSTNGTLVLPPRGRRQRLRAGQSLAVRPGTRVDIGDGNIIEVTR
nr:FHA domain-containing protein [Cryobacterium roopkundense]